MLQSLNRAIPSSDVASIRFVVAPHDGLQSLNRAIPSSDDISSGRWSRWCGCNPSIGQFRLLTSLTTISATKPTRCNPSIGQFRLLTQPGAVIAGCSKMLQSLNRAIPSSDSARAVNAVSPIAVAIPQSGNSVF